MDRLARVTVVLLGGLIVRPAPCAADGPASAPPVEAFGTLPAESDAVLSPDGHWLAWLDHTESKPRVIMFDLEARKAQRILAVPEQTKLRSLVWSDTETLLISVSQTIQQFRGIDAPAEVVRTIAQDVGGGNGRMLLWDPKDGPVPPNGGVVASHITKPKTVIMWTFRRCPNRGSCLMEVDTRTGKGTTFATGTEWTTEWIVDRDGRVVAREDWDWHRRVYKIYAIKDKEYKEIFAKNDGQRPTLAGLLPDASALVLLAANSRAHQAAWTLALDGSGTKLLIDDPDADITGVYYDAYTGAIVGAFVGDMAGSMRWLEPSAQHRFEVLQRSFPGRHVHVYGWTADGQKTLARVQTPSSPPVYYIVDFGTHRADIIAEEYPSLAGLPLGEVRAISYPARDGTPIPAYLTLPAGKDHAPGPLVVLPHGGPHARDHSGFDWLAQFLASRGYAVLQPQFRGSTGFGAAFEQAGYLQWGGLMQDDVTDGVRAMIDQGIADPHRIGIVGASYGGYAALAGVAFTPDMYACAVSIDGISDLPAMMRDTVPIYSGTISTRLAYWQTHIGSANDRNLTAKSPINAVKAIKAPVLIMYGTGDSVVPHTQSTEMVKAMQAAGKSATLVTLAGEDHWLSRTETRIQVLRELESFLREHL